MKFQFLAVLLLSQPPWLFAFDGPKPETIAAFDRYTSLTEAAYSKSLWLDEHKHEKSLVWLNQGFVTEHKTLDQGKEIEAPDAVIQDWIAETFIPGVTIDRVRDVLLDYPNYKTWFKDSVLESRIDKREGDHLDAFLRVHRRQISKVVLNIRFGVDYQLLNPTHATIKAHSTHVGEAIYAKKKPYEEDAAPEDEHGLLYRMNFYWRLEASDNGVYAELEVLTLSREQGRLAAARLLNGFVDNFPKEYTRYTSETVRKMLAPPTGK